MENEFWRVISQFGFGVGLSVGLLGIFKWLVKNVIKNYQDQLATHETIITNHIAESAKTMERVATILLQLEARFTK